MSASVADDLEQRVDKVLVMWSDLSIRHVALGASCGCGMGGISLRLEDFELDIVDYLEDNGQRSGITPVVTFFTELQQAGHGTQPLRKLLTDASEGRVTSEVVEWLLPKVERTLRSFAELHGPRVES